jgi:hypothetical protein
MDEQPNPACGRHHSIIDAARRIWMLHLMRKAARDRLATYGVWIRHKL